MRLKYIGEDDNAFKNGIVYDISVMSFFSGDSIDVKWFDGENFKYKTHSSPAEFAKNWIKPGQKVVVKKKEK